MSRPPTKRQRFNRQSSETIEDGDPFASPSNAHVFAAASSSRSTSSTDLLHPCSYEITLNHDTALKQSLELSASSTDGDEKQSHGSRLVTWTSACRAQTVVTDRYDAVHLLSQLPQKPCPSSRIEAQDLGWSDLDSDTEDLFYMTDAEAAQFVHMKARARLDAQRTARLGDLVSPSPPPTEPETNESKQAEIEEMQWPSEDQFELMQKTAKIITSSTNPSMLELKILANHGGDERFNFLRKGNHIDSKGLHIWNMLKASKGTLTYQATLRKLETATRSQTEVREPGRAGLVPYDDSDSESDTLSKPVDQEKAMPSEANTEDAATLKKQKQAERLARAKVWLQSRSCQPSQS